MYYQRQQRYNRPRLPNSYSQPTSTLLKGLLLTPFNNNPNSRNLLETHSSAERVQTAMGQTRQNYRTYQSPDLREDPYSARNQYYPPKTYKSPYLTQEYQPSYNYTGKQEPTHYPAKQDYNPNFTHRYIDKPDTKTHNPYFQAQREYPTQQYPRRETLNKSNVTRARQRAVIPETQQYNRFNNQERAGRPVRTEGRNTLTGNPNPYTKEQLGVSRKQQKRFDFRNNYR